MKLEDLHIEDFSELLPTLEGVRSLTIRNSTIPNFSELLDLNCYDLYLDNVVFISNECKIKGNLPGHLKFLNMKLDAKALRCFQENNIKGFRQVEFKNCHINNIQYINKMKPISLLILDNITYTYNALKKAGKSRTRRLTICNSTLEDLSFLPFKSSISNLQFERCKIGSIAELLKLDNLHVVSLDSDCKIKDKTPLKRSLAKSLSCVLAQGKKPLDVSTILPLRKAIDSLSLANYKGETIGPIEKFKQLKHLSFENSKVQIDSFLPIAKQINSITFTNSKLKNHESFEQFKNLTRFELNNYGDKKRGLKSFEKILPLKNQLKELEIYDFDKIKQAHLIEEFQALESLKISYEIPIKTAKHILTLKNLRQLSMSVAYKKKCVLSLKKLKKLESLILQTDTNFKGFKYLQNLKSLKLGGDFSEPGIDINSIPKLEKLTRLNITSYNYKFGDLMQFPNLEYLRIKGCYKIKLGKLSKLKVLDLDNADIKNFTKFKKLPKLEKLGLTYARVDPTLEGIDKFPNLRELTVAESNITDLSVLAPLKKLEYLDLYYTFVSNVKVLNSLPNLKEVNLATGSKVDLEKQLDKPELAVYCGLPAIYLSVWEKDEFGI